MESIAGVQQLTILANTSTREYETKIVENMFKANKGVGFSYSMYKVWEITTKKCCIHGFKGKQGSYRKENDMIIIKYLLSPPSSAQDLP